MELTKIVFSIGLLVKVAGNSGLWHVATATSRLGTHGRLSETFGAGGRGTRTLSVLGQLGCTVRLGWIEMLSSSSIAWSGLLDSILRWLVLSLRHSGHLGCTSSWGSCIGDWLGGSHWLGCILRSHLRLDNWSVDDLLGWHELLASW